MRTVLVAGAIVPIVFVAGIAVLQPRFANVLSHKALVERFEASRADGRLIYVGQRPPSAEFYARGKAIKVANLAALSPYLADGVTDFVVVRTDDLARAAPALRGRLLLVGDFGEYRLLRELR